VYHLLDIFLCAALAKPMQQNTSCTTNGLPPFVVYAAGVPPAASQLLLRSKTKEGILPWVVESDHHNTTT